MNESYDFYDSGSGEDIFNITNTTDDGNKDKTVDLVALLALFSICILVCLYAICKGLCIVGYLIAFRCERIFGCKKKYKELFNIGPILPIKNDKLSKRYINKMKSINKTNFIEHYNKSTDLDMTCGICMENMKIKRQKIIYLNCGHIFHDNCIQSWVKTNIQNGEIPSCPKCRFCIIDNSILNEENQKEIYYYSSDSDTDYY